MSNPVLSRRESILFLVTFLLPLSAATLLALGGFPQLLPLLPVSLLFPAGLLAGIGLRAARS